MSRESTHYLPRYEVTDWVKVLVCGGRDYDDVSAVYKSLDEFHARWPIDLLIHGGADGADSIADRWADLNGIQRAVFEVTPRRWQKAGRKAGPIRNRMMLLLNPSAVLAFPTGGPGTKDMIDAARLAGVANIQIHETKTAPEGAVE